MRYAIVSDLHANRQAWEAVLADSSARGVEAIICLGDVVGYGPMPQWLLDDVRQRCAAVVIGNHDAAACGRLDASIFNDEAREVVEWTRQRIDADGLRFLAGLPAAVEDDDVLYVHAEVEFPERFDYITVAQNAAENLAACRHGLVFYGHTHTPAVFVEKADGVVHECSTTDFSMVEGCRYLVNVGSVGEPRNPEDLRARYAIYDSDQRSVEFCAVEFDKAAYRADLDAQGLPVVPYFLQVHEMQLAEPGSGRPAVVGEQRAMRLLSISQVRTDAAGAAQPSRLILPLRHGETRPGQKPVDLSPEKKSSDGAGKWIAALLLIAIGVGAGWWFFGGGKHADQAAVDLQSKLAEEASERLLEGGQTELVASAERPGGATASAIAGRASLPLSSGLLTYLPLDKNVTPTIGTLQPKPKSAGMPKLVAGRLGNSLQLDRAASVGLGAAGDYGIGESGLTVSAWYQAAGRDNERRILMSNLPTDASGGPGWQIVVSQATATFMMQDGSETARATIVRNRETPAERKKAWRHLVAVVDPDSGEIRIHLNAGEPAVAPLGDVDLSALQTQRGLTLGAAAGMPEPLKFAGRLDDLAIWGRALNRTEVDDIRKAANEKKQALGDLLGAQPATSEAKQ